MIYTGLLSLLLAEYAANQKCSAVLLCSAALPIQYTRMLKCYVNQRQNSKAKTKFYRVKVDAKH